MQRAGGITRRPFLFRSQPWNFEKRIQRRNGETRRDHSDPDSEVPLRGGGASSASVVSRTFGAVDSSITWCVPVAPTSRLPITRRFENRSRSAWLTRFTSGASKKHRR